ncbi:LysM peptidoglycan-binding domain-containing protein [Candidatus Peregrinibacteria bacterium]|nr:LysM peptidoglycan-binding domain-containing protein [Candidatus Peregrinibacteria bacterium]
MKRSYRLKIGILLGAITLMTFPLQSLASYNVLLNDGFSGILNYTLNPGDSKTDKISIINLDDKPLIVRVYAADGTKSSQGTFALTDVTDEQRTIGKWVKIEKDIVEIPPNEKIDVSFSVTTPDTITPGTYSGGIATESISNKVSPKSGAPVLATKARLVNKLFVKVPGEKKHSPEWTGFEYKKIGGGNNSFTLKFKNTGNSYVIGESKVEIFGVPNAQPSDFEIKDDMPQELKDQKVKQKYDHTIKFNNVDLTQNSESQVTGYWKLKPLFGSYTAKATVIFYEYDVETGKKINPQTLTKEIQFSIIDFNIILLIILLIGLVGSTLGAQQLYYQGKRKNSDVYTVKTGDTIMNIAKSKNIHWKTLTKINKLKAPYEVSPNQKILIPKSKKAKA